MSNTPITLNLSKMQTYREKYNLMFGLLIAYNSYCINYYTLKPELVYKADINPFDIEYNEKIIEIQRKLEISQKFSFHTKTANFLSSADIVINATRTILNKMNCDTITNIKYNKVQKMDISLKLVKELRNTYVHGKLLPIHFISNTTFGKQEISSIFHIVIMREYLLSLKNITGDLKKYLTESTKDSIDLYDLFEQHFKFNSDLYNSIRNEFLKLYVIDETTRLHHKNLCLFNGIGQNLNLIQIKP